MLASSKGFFIEKQTQRFVVFTDMDGTLLDHDTYEWQPAAPSLDALKRLGAPVILISSKTLAELLVYRRDLALPHPVVAENGAVIDVPADYFPSACRVTENVVSRPALQETFQALRDEIGARCTAFFELGATGIAKATGLSIEQAALANQRRASEPLLWQDNPESLKRFCDVASERGLRCLRGGRFVHLMGQTDKADAMSRLLGAYRQKWPGVKLISVALGDSPNDLGMLRSADIAVVIPARQKVIMDLSDHPRVLRATRPGPAGWHDAMQSILNSNTEYQNLG